MSDTRFNHCLKFVLRWEGGYVDHPADKGGKTNMGITEKTLKSYRKIQKDIKDLNQDDVRQIYFDLYWIPSRCAQWPEPMDLVVFDTAVNSGTGRALKILQACLGVAEDGVIGQVTLNALMEDIAAGRVDELVDDYIRRREEYYQSIVKTNPTQQVFLRGWMNRMSALRKEVQES